MGRTKELLGCDLLQRKNKLINFYLQNSLDTYLEIQLEPWRPISDRSQGRWRRTDTTEQVQRGGDGCGAGRGAQSGPDEAVGLVGLPGEDLVLAALAHMDLDAGFVHKILEGALHTLLEKVHDIVHVGVILRKVKEPGN